MSRSKVDVHLGVVLAAAGALSTLIVALIVLFLVKESWPILRSVGVSRFLTDAGWHPSQNSYGLAPMLVATLATSVLATIVAAPIAIGSALFSRFIAPRPVARVQRALIALLAGIPSVVYGFWGLVVIVPIIAAFAPPGASLLAGSIVLAIMILPTIALMTDAALASVPPHYGQGAAALGLSREAIMLRVLLPAARSGIVAGILLAFARALGETMAVLMVAGNVVQMPTSLFDPVRTLTANIALEMAYATDAHRQSLFVSGLALTLLVGIVVVIAWMRTERRADV